MHGLLALPAMRVDPATLLRNAQDDSGVCFATRRMTESLLRNAHDKNGLYYSPYTVRHAVKQHHRTVTDQTQLVIAGLTRNLRRILVRLRLGGRNDGLQSD